ncbi:hypothetical protein [Baaleninema simplex]|uniref:hypothetical protein n=1 Tax=Baaleninema simplex TaxID=2862350 RepID=UPI00037FE2A8|nr:hypothetical protein [Baaleninema simplex]
MNTGAKKGLPSTPETIRVGTVRMQDHPDYPNLINQIESLGFEVRMTSNDPYVSVIEYVDRQGVVLEVERVVNLQENMRFLDLEHEFGHVQQLTERFGGNMLTDRYIRRPNGTTKRSRMRHGILTNEQDAVTEYHNRLEEFLRLEERRADLEVLREHAEGVRDWRSVYRDRLRSPTLREWATQYFPDIPSLEQRYSSGGRPLE